MENKNPIRRQLVKKEETWKLKRKKTSNISKRFMRKIAYYLVLHFILKNVREEVYTSFIFYIQKIYEKSVD